MILMEEIKDGTKSIFKRTHINSNNSIVYEETFYYRLFKVNDDNFIKFVLYDDNMVVISDAYNYINTHISSQSTNSREKAIYAIRLLYCFLDLTKSKITNLSRENIEQLKFFLLGYSPNKGNYSLEMKTQRTNGTVDSYLSIYRSYFKFLKINCPYLFELNSPTIVTTNPATESTIKKSSYKANLKTSKPERRVPRYISVQEFDKIISIIREEKNILAECIIRLMYQFGLRIGEVLGLTFEDITEIEIDNNFVPVILLRNRVSDKHFQKCKTCMNVSNTNQYRSANYKTENLGYQQIIITYEIYELINTYIDNFHSVARENNITRYTEKVCADKVVNDKYSDDNFYIFINSIGKTLSEQSWNKYLRTLFTAANLHIDKNSKKHNLNHRFRHGFAMFHVQYLKTSIIELQKLMRHASPASTMIYYNPTESDEAKIKNSFVNELYDLLPTLKENIYE